MFHKLTPFQSHPTHRSYRTETFADYEDLRIAIWNGTAIGRHAIGLGDDTDARTHEEAENRGSNLDGLIYDHNTETFIHSDMQDSLYQSSSYGFSHSPQPSETMNPDIPLARKRHNRNEFEGKSTSFEPSNSQSDIMNKLTQSVDKLVEAIKSFDSS